VFAGVKARARDLLHFANFHVTLSTALLFATMQVAACVGSALSLSSDVATGEALRG